MPLSSFRMGCTFVSHSIVRAVARGGLCLLIACAGVSHAANGNFAVWPTDLNFGDGYIGASVAIKVTVKNVSTVNQTPSFAGGGSGDPNFTGSTSCVGVTLSPGGTCTFTYTFHPTTFGTKSGSTGIGINAEYFAVTFTGNGISPFLVSPTTLDFGNAAVGSTATIPVTIRNISPVSQTPAFSGGGTGSGPFGASQNCAGVTLAAGASCVFTYTFQPTSLGASTGTTSIGIGSETFPISLSGTGAAGSAATAKFSLAPRVLNFDSVAVGTTRAINVVIQNVSSSTQTLSLAGGGPLDPTNFAGVSLCPSTLAAGASCSIKYNFGPQSKGAFSTSTTIVVGGDYFALNFSGTGVSAFAVWPTTLNFGGVTTGTSANLTLIIKNVSQDTLTPSFSGGGPFDSTNFGAGQSCGSVTLVANATCTFTYTFHPTTAGAKTSSTSIGIGAESFAINLFGTGLTTFPSTFSVVSRKYHGLNPPVIFDLPIQ